MKKELTTTNINKSHQKMLKQLAAKFELSQVDLMNNAIEYFKETGINPADKITNPKEELSKLNKRVDKVIRFIRVHERDKLSPLLDSLIVIDRRLKDKLEFILTRDDLSNLEKSLNDSLIEFKDEIRKIENHLNKIQTSISTANKNYVTGYNNQKVYVERIVQLIELLFTMLINKRFGGYSKKDIQNFKDALSKIR